MMSRRQVGGLRATLTDASTKRLEGQRAGYGGVDKRPSEIRRLKGCNRKRYSHIYLKYIPW